MIPVRALVLFIAPLLLPSLTFADSFHSLGAATVFQSRDHIYRLRSSTKPWQLAEQSGLGGLSIKIGSTIFSFFDGQLYESRDALSYRPVSISNLTNPKFISSQDSNLLYGHTPQGDKVWQYRDSWNEVRNTPMTSFLTEQIGQSVGAPSLLIYLLGELRAFVANDGEWRLQASVSCPGVASYFNRPLPGAFCSDGSSWLFNGQVIEELFSESAILAGASDSHLLAKDSSLANKFYLYENGMQYTLTINSTENPSNAFLISDRIMLSFPTIGLQELLWRSDPVELLPVTTSYSSVVDGGTGSVVVSANTSAYISASPGQWQYVTAVGNFNHAQKLSSGWWAYQTNDVQTIGGLAQFLANGQTGFIKVNLWSSTTSPIQATHLASSLALVSVVTSSGTGNVNLYKSTDLINWSRITLPTNRTLVRPIGEARLLPVGTLVETQGTLTVPAGVVGQEIAYIQDTSGGIQIYLSANKGSISIPRGNLVVVNGEVSSSQAKRLIIDELDDMTDSGPGVAYEPVSVTVAQVEDFQGRVVLLRDSIVELSTVYLFLAPELKFHFDSLGQNLKTIFQPEDLIEASAVVDWNSSTDQVEAWYTGGRYSIIERKKTVTTSPASTTSKSKSAAVSKKSASPSTTSTKRSVAEKTVSSRPLVQGVKSSAPDAVVAGSVSESSQLSTTILTFLGIVTGMLAIQGRRFRKLIE